MKLSMRDQMILVGVLLLAGAAAFVFLLIVPQFQKIGRINGEISAADQETVDAQALLDRRIAARDNAAKTSAELLLLGNRVPEAPELPALIIAMQDMADASGMQLQRIAPQDATVEGGEGYTARNITLALVGRWPDYIDFVRRLQKTTRGIRVLSASASVLEMEESDTDMTPGTVQETLIAVTMDIQVYTYEGAAAAAPPAEPTQ